MSILCLLFMVVSLILLLKIIIQKCQIAKIK